VTTSTWSNYSGQAVSATRAELAGVAHDPFESVQRLERVASIVDEVHTSAAGRDGETE
jgi:hypothetical protein